MQYTYQTQKLLNDGVNFAAIYPEKQGVIKEMTGFDFSLPEIVQFLKTETDNFTKQNPIALDMDNYIVAIHNKWKGKSESGAEPTPKSEPNGGGNASEIAKMVQERQDIDDILELLTNKAEIKKMKQERKDVEDMIALLEATK